MKISYNALVVVFLSIVFATSYFNKTTGEPGAQPVSLNESNSGKTVVIQKQQILTLTLFDKVDGGYRFDRPQYDSTVLQLVKLIENPPAANSAPGQPGQATWQFTTLKTGKTALTVTATRPWANGGSITVFSNIVIVK